MSAPNPSVHPSAIVDEGAQVGDGTRIWHFCHVSSRARVGRDCVLGQNVFVADGVVVGDNVRIQNNVSLYDGVVLEDDVFCGPSAVFTNVRTPRSGVSRKDEYAPTVVRRGATIGANATVVCGVEIGAFSLVGAGAVVTTDSPRTGSSLGCLRVRLAGSAMQARSWTTIWFAHGPGAGTK